MAAQAQNKMAGWARRISGAALFAALLAAAPASAEVPASLALQGRLTNGAGFAVPDGDYGMTLRFYAKSSDTKPVWIYVDPGVKVSKGVFLVFIGDKLPLEKKEFLSGNAGYVTVQIGSEGELGKLPLTPVAYALRADMAATAQNLECSGCISASHLDASVLAPYAKASSLSKVAASGSWTDLTDKPKMVLVAQACPMGEVATGIDGDGKLTCAKPAAYTGANFATSGQACPSGQVVIGIAADGKVSCAADKDTDTNTTYSGANFATSSQACPGGQVVTGIGSNGAVTCAADKDTDTNTTYSGANFATSSQACPGGQVVTGIGSNGAVTCAADKDTDTNTTYSGANFATSNQACPAGQMVTGIGSNGAVSCAAAAVSPKTGVLVANTSVVTSAPFTNNNGSVIETVIVENYGTMYRITCMMAAGNLMYCSNITTSGTTVTTSVWSANWGATETKVAFALNNGSKFLVNVGNSPSVSVQGGPANVTSYSIQNL